MSGQSKAAQALSLEERCAIVRKTLLSFLSALERVGEIDLAHTQSYKDLLKGDFKAFEDSCTNNRQRFFGAGWKEMVETCRSTLGDDATDAALREIRRSKDLN